MNAQRHRFERGRRRECEREKRSALRETAAEAERALSKVGAVGRDGR